MATIEHENIGQEHLHETKYHGACHVEDGGHWKIPTATTSADGLLPKLPNDSTKYLNGVGVWDVPAGSGGSSTWTGLSDTASSIVADQLVVGNGSGTALEFVNPNTLDVDMVDGCHAGATNGDVFKIFSSYVEYGIFYKYSGGIAALSPGADGYQLTTHGAGSAPTWEPPGSGGSGADYTIDGGNATSNYTGTAVIDCGGAS